MQVVLVHLIRIICVIMIAGSPSILLAETDWRAVELKLGQIVKQPEFVERVIKLNGVPPSREALVREHLRSLYDEPIVLSSIVKELASLSQNGMKGGKSGFDFGRKLGAEWMFSTSIKGLLRLSPEEQRAFISYMKTLLEVSTPAQCAWLVAKAGTITAIEGAQLEYKLMPLINETTVRVYLFLLRKAALAELNDYPLPRTLNKDQLSIADAALQQALANAIKRGRLSLETLEAMDNPLTAEPTTICDAGVNIYEAVLQSRGMAGDFLVLKIITQLQ